MNRATAGSTVFAMTVLAAAVEVIAGKSSGIMSAKNIFEPLGITASYTDSDAVKKLMCTQYRFVDGSDTDILKAQSSAVDSSIGGIIENEGLNNVHILGDRYDSGGAGIITKACRSMQSCVQPLANGGSLNGDKIISRGTIDLWRTNQLDENQMKQFNWAHLSGYGYGLGVRTMIDRAKSGSNGPLGECDWGGAAGAVSLIDTDNNVSLFYAHHMLNNQEAYVLPRMRKRFVYMHMIKL